MALNISILKREDDGLIIIALKGSLDSETYRELKTKAQKYLDQTPKAILFDLQELDYISSMGISTLLEIRKILENKGGSLMMANVPPQIDHVFKIVNALPDLQIFKDIEEADQYFMEIERKIKEKRG